MKNDIKKVFDKLIGGVTRADDNPLEPSDEEAQAIAFEEAKAAVKKRRSQRQQKNKHEFKSDLPKVVLTLDYGHVADQVIWHLAKLGWDPLEDREKQRLYRRGGALVEVVVDHQAGSLRGGVAMPSGAARIRPLPQAQLPLRITSACSLVTVVQKKDGDIVENPTAPPRWLVEGVFTQGNFDHVRPLAGIITAPTLRADGSIVQVAGYDDATGLLYRPEAAFPKVPDTPTREDAKRAVDELLEVVSDFEFQSDHDKAAWVALVLSQIARQAVDGCVPLFAITSTTRGSGKSLLADAASLIAFGRSAARKTYSADDDEMRKAITATALEALPSVLIDNVDRPLGGASLDAALTATTWSDRILGSNRTTGDLPLRTVWTATGNNLSFASDIARRVLPIRLSPTHENPEERTDFAHPNLLAWVRENRPRLAVAALTLARAYFVAGRPEQAGAAFGSFEAWAEIIRGAIVWVGLADPLVTRETAKADDTSGAIVRGLVGGLLELDEYGDGMTAREIVAKLADDATGARYPAMREVVAEVAMHRGVVDQKRLGYSLRKYKGRISNGFCINAKPGRGGVVRWFADRVGSGGDGGDAFFDPNHHPNHAAPRNCVDKTAVGWDGWDTSPVHACEENSSFPALTHIALGDGLKTSPPSQPSQPKAKAEATKYPCPRCGAKLVRLPTTQIIDGWVNLDCLTPGCKGIKPIRVADTTQESRT